ncbi:MAG: RecQ family ATP-dependent DNA helicase [Kiritimatiellae bacterium]|jgi:ATP-dependent DNA helicase RecQ|nr:RecQ family ATP-dependent DNA helicase [Kiritimatiellia bacterium]
MKNIVFFDTEIGTDNKKVFDIGCIKHDGSIFHSNCFTDFVTFLQGAEYVCGHNIIHHDIKYLHQTHCSEFLRDLKIIDTLYLSPLLFPNRPYHKLVKDDKLQTDDINNPVNDSLKAKDLFCDEISAFNLLDEPLKKIYYLLLNDKPEFAGFFEYLSYQTEDCDDISELINRYFPEKYCLNSPIEKILKKYPVGLAYSLALISSTDRYSVTPPWVLVRFPEVASIMHFMRNKPCLEGCAYCEDALNAKKGLKNFFGFDSYRTYGGEPLQENAVQAAIDGKSLLAVFPTGGGKSLTFQIPALMSGRNEKGLTVVISPLQSLMKDQVDNLENSGITEAATINGLLDPIARAESFERVQNGSVTLLYISPESLRSRSIERLIQGRNIVRFVIDEAHCFSAWGQDFRVDYLYIAEFISKIQKTKNLLEPIPVSCFTATAKQNVIEDICRYFNDNLSLHLEVYRADASRTNLEYKVFDSKDEEGKYNYLRELLSVYDCPSIVYVSRTQRAYELANKLKEDGYNAKPFHGKMDTEQKVKNQNDFISGDVRIMVATSAFGMGVDKKDVGLVVHYNISDSLENYVQEAGRAGRNEEISAKCFVLFNEEDLNKHFVLLNQTKLSVKEIQQVWKAIKHITKFRSHVSNSALEIARQAGWDDNVLEIETRVKTALAALEHSGYLKRGQNMPRVYATSILTKNAMQAIDKINASTKFSETEKEQARRIISKLVSAKSRKSVGEDVAEARVDYISDHLGILTKDVIKIVTLLREENILADTKDLTAYIKANESDNRSSNIANTYFKIEDFLFSHIEEKKKSYNIKELNELAAENGCTQVTPQKIKTILNFWAIKNWVKRECQQYNDRFDIAFSLPKDSLKNKWERRHELSKFIVSNLYNRVSPEDKKKIGASEEVLVEFSVHEVKNMYEQDNLLFKQNISIDDIEDTLFYLSRIDSIKIDGGFLVSYNKLTIDRLEQNNQIHYKKSDYQQLEAFYQSKIEQIHIVGEYARKMLEDYDEALRFVEDYFKLNYSVFLRKYFPGGRGEEIRRNITPKKFKQLFGELSPRQLKIIKDKEHQNILVAAGPGSGKTRVLVHKLASLLLMEDVKHEQLLMLTFSRAAATEFKKRLFELISTPANYIEIKTFHSYCFELLGRIGSIEKSDSIIQETSEKINNGDVEQNRITKNVLVIDEAQDMNIAEFNLVKSLMNKNEEMRVIAVGDDDQNIYTFRGSDSKYFEKFVYEDNSIKYELIENYRSKRNLVEFTNNFVTGIQQRLKISPIVASQKDDGIIIITHYNSRNLFIPIINDILVKVQTGTTAVLTQTNDEATQIKGMLVKNGMPARLIQSKVSFNLFDLIEIRTFFNDLNLFPTAHVISLDSWNEAKRQFHKKYATSSNYDLCRKMLTEFQDANPKTKYKSDFQIFIRESELEDFAPQSQNVVNVSTIHKAKGKEFDTVFILLNNFQLQDDESKRQLYVGMTRAKSNLFIHYNGSYFDNVYAAGVEHVNDHTQYPEPQYLLLQLGHKDIYLDFFKSVQKHINELQSGEELQIAEDGLMNSKSQYVLKFSKKFINDKNIWLDKGYSLEKANVNFILYWHKQDDDPQNLEEIKIVLPELYFAKHNVT